MQLPIVELLVSKLATGRCSKLFYGYRRMVFVQMIVIGGVVWWAQSERHVCMAFKKGRMNKLQSLLVHKYATLCCCCLVHVCFNSFVEICFLVRDLF